MSDDKAGKLISSLSDVERIDTGLLFLVGLVGGYVLLVPSVSLIPSLSLYNEKRVVQVIVVIAVGVIVLASRPVRRRWLSVFWELPTVARWGLGVVLGLGLLSSALAPAPFYAFLEVNHFVLLFVAAGGVAATVRCVPKLPKRVFLGVVVGGAVLYVAYFVVGYGMHLAMEDIKLWPDGATNFGNIRFFNHYQTWTLPLLAGTLLAIPRGWRVLRGGVFAIVALWWALVLASGVRGTIVGMVVAGLGIVFLFRRRASRWLVVQVAALLAGVALYYLLFSTGEPPVATERFQQIGKSGSRRLQLWQVSLEMLGANPWLGAGPMHFAWPPYQFALPPASPHNAIMQWLAEWGLPSTLIMIGFTTWGGWQYIMQERVRSEQADDPNAVGIALVASLLAGAAHSVVSGIIIAPLSQMCLVLVGGWAWGRYRPSKREGEASPSLEAHAVLCVLLLGSMVVVGSSLRDLSVTEERRSAFEEAVDRNRFSPRYWTQGYLGVRDSSVMDRARRDL